MTTRWISMILVAVGCVSLSAARAGERPAGPPPGPLQQILEHAKDLGLTDEQKTKVEALIKEIGPNKDGTGPGAAMREKLKEHPELAREMKEARDSGDPAKIKEVRAKIAEKLGMKDGAGAGPAADGKRGEVMGKLAQILTPDQMQKLKELREQRMADGGGPRAGRGGKGGDTGGDKSGANKPDTSKGAPSVFDN